MSETHDENQDDNQPESSGDKPLARVQYGKVSAAVFPQKGTRSDGTEFDDFTISLQRSYMNAEGEWVRRNISFYRREVLAAAKALEDAFQKSYELGKK